MFSWAFGKWFSTTGGWSSIIAISFLWLVVDGLRGWIFSGFPWLYPGYAFIDSPLANWAPIMGVHSITLLVIFSALITLNLLQKIGSITSIVALSVIWIGSTLLGLVNWSTATGEPITATLIQPSIPQKLKWEEDYFWKTINILEQKTRQAKGQILLPPQQLQMVKQLLLGYQLEMETNPPTIMAQLL